MFAEVVERDGEFAGVFRVDDRSRTMTIRVGRSRDGLAWELAREPIAFVPVDARLPARPGAGVRARRRRPERRLSDRALVDRDADQVSLYYGAADTVVCLAHARLSEVVASLQ